MADDILGRITMDAKPGSAPKMSSFGRIPKKTPVTSSQSSGDSTSSKMEIDNDRKRRAEDCDLSERARITDGYMKPMQQSNVVSNLFKIDIRNAHRKLDRFHIVIVIMKKTKEFVVNEMKRGVGDVGKRLRRDALFSIVQSFKKHYSDVFTKGPLVYDCGSAIYTLDKTISLQDGEEKTMILEVDKLEKVALQVLGGPKFKAVRMVMTKDLEVSMDAVDEVGQKEVQKFLEIVTSQYMFERQFLNFGGKFFDSKNVKNTFKQECKEIKLGCEKAVKMCGTAENAQFYLLLDVRTAPFYMKMSLMHYLIERLRCRESEVGRALKRKDLFLDELKTITVETTHRPGENETFFISDVSSENASMSFETSNGRKTVAEYFLERHKLRLRFPELPLIIRKIGAKRSFYPIEILEISPGQRLKTAYIPPIIQKELVAAFKPHERVYQYDKLRSDMKIDSASSNSYLQAFGIGICSEMKNVTVSRILPPTIVFANKRSEQPQSFPGKEPSFSRSRERFFKPSEIDFMYVLYIETERRRISIDEKRFESNLERACKDKGIMVRKMRSGFATTFDEIDAKLRKEEFGSPKSILFALTNENKDHAHEILKLLESRYGVQTMHICAKTASAIVKGGGTTVDNIVRKLNAKTGGINFMIQIPQSLLNSRIEKRPNIDLNTLLFKNTMIVGIEMSHASAQCLFDQQNNIATGEPSVVGLSFSYEDSTDHGGYFWLQKPRETRLLHLEENFSKSLTMYRQKTGKLPENIIIYRSSPGDSFMNNVLQEVEDIRSSMKIFPNYKPSLVFILQNRKSLYRFFAPGNRRGEFNQVDAGTCAYQSITNVKNEFILVSQHGRLGTSTPSRYQIVVNELNLTTVDLSNFTYFLCFGHPVSYSVTSAPDIIFSACNNAKRGRNNFLAERREKCVQLNRNDLAAKEDEAEAYAEITKRLSNLAVSQHNYWA